MRYNQTKAICHKTVCAQSLTKVFGLMFHPPLKDSALIFCFPSEKRRGIHMWFVFFPIDVLFLDRRKRIVEKATLRPFCWYNPKYAAQYIVELPAGATKGCKIGDRVRFKCE